MRNANNPNQIDLLDLIRLTSKQIHIFFKWIGRQLILFVLFMKRYFYVYLVCLVFCLASGYALDWKYNKPVFSSSMNAMCYTVPSKDIIEVVNNLHKALKEKNTSYVATQLGCDIEDVKQIKDIEAFHVIDINKDSIADYVDYDHTLEKKTAKDSNMVALASELAVKLDYLDVNIISKVKNGLINYLRRSEYITNKDSIYRKQLSDLIKKTNEEIRLFDTLQTNYNKSIIHRGQDLRSQLLPTNEKDVKLLYKDALKLYEEKQQLEQKLALSGKDIIQAKTDFTPSSAPVNRDIIPYFTLFLIVPLVMTTLYSLIKERSYFLKKLERLK